jgi:hypothetical protein
MEIEADLEQLTDASICAPPTNIGMRQDASEERNTADAAASPMRHDKFVRGVDEKTERILCHRLTGPEHQTAVVQRSEARHI